MADLRLRYEKNTANRFLSHTSAGCQYPTALTNHLFLPEGKQYADHFDYTGNSLYYRDNISFCIHMEFQYLHSNSKHPKDYRCGKHNPRLSAQFHHKDRICPDSSRPPDDHRPKCLPSKGHLQYRTRLYEGQNTSLCDHKA